MKESTKIEAEDIKYNEGVIYSNRSYGFFQDVPKMLSRVNDLEERGILNKEDAHYQRTQIIEILNKVYAARHPRNKSRDSCRIL